MAFHEKKQISGETCLSFLCLCDSPLDGGGGLLGLSQRVDERAVVQDVALALREHAQDGRLELRQLFAVRRHLQQQRDLALLDVGPLAHNLYRTDTENHPNKRGIEDHGKRNYSSGGVSWIEKRGYRHGEELIFESRHCHREVDDCHLT